MISPLVAVRPAFVGFFAAFAACIVLVLTKRFHGRYSIDGTVGVQKFHSAPTPRIGGVAILVGIIAAYTQAPASVRLILAPMLIAGVPALGAGLVEDITKKVGVRARLLATMFSGFFAWYLTGVAMQNTGVPPLDWMLGFTPIAVLFTAFAVAGVSNAVNIVDGFNGLAAGAVCIILSAMGIISLNVGDTDLATICFVLIAVLLGFACLNWPHGKIFLGDGGAYFVGFLLGWIAILLPMRNTQLTAWVTLLACAYPILEVAFSCRRKSKRDGYHPGQPDKLHLHMLVYRRIARPAYSQASCTLQNSMTSPLLWAFAFVPAAWAIEFQLQTGMLILGFFFAASLYWVFYLRLTQFIWCLTPALAQVGSRAASKVICVAAEEHRFLVTEAMRAAKVSGLVILEPSARNTAAAMALAALAAQPEQLLLFCPADHHIPDAQAFATMVEQGRVAAEGGVIVTFGVLPSFPSTAYGYIRQGGARPDGTHTVARFIEKPVADEARALILQGDVLWNAGIFLCQAATLLKALQQHAPDILASCQQAIAGAVPDEQFIRPESQAFNACRSESIDYAVMEHHGDVAVVPFSAAWSDVGSWDAVADLTVPDQQGNRLVGQGLAIDARQTYIHAPHRPGVALGTHDLLIIDTPDALLVAARSHAESVKTVVAALEARQSPQASLHRKVARPWGFYDSIDAGERFNVKRIAVKPGASLSLQKHYHRAEHWIVVKGRAEVTCGDETFLLTENQSTYIPIGEVHRLHNPGKTELEMIEVQSGSYLGEDDIVRFEDDYGRVIPIRAVG